MSTSFGLTSGFLCHFWYNYLDRFLPGSTLRIVVKKVLIDQTVFSPVCIAACLTTAHLVEEGIKNVKSHNNLGLWDVGKKLFLAELVIWPPAQFANFYFLPTRYRVVFDNAVSLAYDVYTSKVKHQPSNKIICKHQKVG